MDPMDIGKATEDMGNETNIDQWLDAALRGYSQANPRGGLESRVLASLDAERNRRAFRLRWWWMIGVGAAAAAVVAVVWVGDSGRDRTPATHVASSATVHRETAEAAKPRFDATAVQAASNSALNNRPQPRRHEQHETGTLRQAEFPSARPLDEQERMLLSYVTRDPETAALVAEARAEARRQDLEDEAKAMGRKASGTDAEQTANE